MLEVSALSLSLELAWVGVLAVEGELLRQVERMTGVDGFRDLYLQIRHFLMR